MAFLRDHRDAKPTRTAPRSPWQNGVAEPWIGSVRRELLDHVVVFDDRHLQRLLRECVAYQHDDRTHLGLAKAKPAGRPRQTRPVGDAEVIALPRLGGLHHRYEWRGPGMKAHATINVGYHRSGRTAPVSS
jgi:transposase InsO family protein